MSEDSYCVYRNGDLMSRHPYTVDGLVQAIDSCSELNRTKTKYKVVRIANPYGVCCNDPECSVHKSGLTKQEREVLDLFGEGFY